MSCVSSYLSSPCMQSCSESAVQSGVWCCCEYLENIETTVYVSMSGQDPRRDTIVISGEEITDSLIQPETPSTRSTTLTVASLPNGIASDFLFSLLTEPRSAELRSQAVQHEPPWNPPSTSTSLVTIPGNSPHLGLRITSGSIQT